MSTRAMHRMYVVQELIETLEPDTWAMTYWRGVLESLKQLNHLHTNAVKFPYA
jgi:hypothetical protein